MIGVDHIDVREIRCCGFVGKVHRVLERQVPDGERLILGVARARAAAVLMIELAQARRHLARAGTRRGDHHDGAGGLDVVVFAVAVVGDDQRDVGRVVLDGIVPVDGHAEILQLAREQVGGVLPMILRDDNAAHIQPDGAEGVDQAHDVQIVGDAEVAAALVLLDVRGVDGDDDLGVVF